MCMAILLTSSLPAEFAGVGGRALPEFEGSIETGDRLCSELLDLKAYRRPSSPRLSQPVLHSSHFETWRNRAEQTLAFVKRLDIEAV